MYDLASWALPDISPAGCHAAKTGTKTGCSYLQLQGPLAAAIFSRDGSRITRCQTRQQTDRAGAHPAYAPRKILCIRDQTTVRMSLRSGCWLQTTKQTHQQCAAAAGWSCNVNSTTHCSRREEAGRAAATASHWAAHVQMLPHGQATVHKHHRASSGFFYCASRRAHMLHGPCDVLDGSVSAALQPDRQTSPGGCCKHIQPELTMTQTHTQALQAVSNPPIGSSSPGVSPVVTGCWQQWLQQGGRGVHNPGRAPMLSARPPPSPPGAGTAGPLPPAAPANQSGACCG